MPDDPKKNNPADPSNFLLPKMDPGFKAGAIGGVAPEAQRTELVRDGAESEARDANVQGVSPEARPEELDAALADTAVKPADAAPVNKEGVGSLLRPLRTYRGDVEETMKETRASVVSIAAAEEARRAKVGGRIADAPARSRLGLIAIIVSIFLVLGGIALVSFFVLRTPAATSERITPPSFIYVDQADEEDATETSRSELMTTLVVDRTNTALPLGLMRQVFFTKKTGTSTRTLISSQEFLRTVAPEAPGALLRTLDEPFMIAIHVFEGNQPLLMFKADSYEQAFSGMIAWEETMQEELSPLFTRTPRPKAPGDTTPDAAIQFLSSRFVDRIVDNRDTRVIEDARGNILLLWTFLDRATILITTNEYTLREVVSRIKNAPLLPSTLP